MPADDSIIASHQLNILIDHSQIFLEDCEHTGSDFDVNLLYSDEAFARHLGVAPGVLAIFTARHYGTVRLEILLMSVQPDDDFTGWDNVVEASIALPSGCLVAFGPESYPPLGSRIAIAQGAYRARVYAGGIEALDDEYAPEGPDHYRVALWPAPYQPPALLYARLADPW